jgi:glycosyltransferase involved in cell wall biosynthesis
VVGDARISVVIPTFNREVALPRAINSVVAQTYSRWELVIVDDGSTDGTADAVQPFLSDHRVTFQRRPRGGAGAARNFGAGVATGTFLTFLDSDDVAATKWLATLVDTFEAEAADVVTSLHEIHLPTGTRTRGSWSNYDPMFPGVVGNFTHGGTWAVRRKLFLELGGFNGTLQAAQHTEFGYRLLAEVEKRGLTVARVDEPLITYFSSRPDSVRQDDAAVLQGAEYMIQRHGNRMLRDPARLANSHAVAAYRAARLGMRSRARKHANAALKLAPRDLRAWARAAALWIWIIRPRRWRARRAAAQ